MWDQQLSMITFSEVNSSCFQRLHRSVLQTGGGDVRRAAARGRRARGAGAGLGARPHPRRQGGAGRRLQRPRVGHASLHPPAVRRLVGELHRQVSPS